MLKKYLEALLFSAGRKMSIEELSQVTKAKQEEIKSALVELKMEYDGKNSSLMLINEGDFWKLTVREPFLPLVRKIITETELSKTVLETLAVIAFKYPIKQSELIKIRTNKAYDHLKELEQMGYISRQKHGRTNLIKLTQKFFEYFDLREEGLKEAFSDFSSIAKSIEQKEAEVKKIKEEQKARAGQEKTKDEQAKSAIQQLDEQDSGVSLQPYGQEAKEEEKKEGNNAAASNKKLGSLEVVDEPSEEELEKERQRLQQFKDESRKKIPKQKKTSKEHPKQPVEAGIKLTQEEEKLVDKEVENILHPQEEAPAAEKTGEAKEPELAAKEKDLLEAEMDKKEEDNDKEKQSEYS